MILYHGGSANQPKVANQKELGIQCSPNPLESDLHYVTRITKCDADVSDAVVCDDMHNWASLEAFYAILSNAGVENGVEIATNAWRSNNCRTNTKEASAVMRDVLLQYGITSIAYIDSDDLPGTECYILLTDQEFHVVSNLAEGWPNLAEANAYLPEKFQIEVVIDYRPHYNDGTGFYDLVPKSLFLESPKKVANYILDSINDKHQVRSKRSSLLDQLEDLIVSDFKYAVKNDGNIIRVFIHSDSMIDVSNPAIVAKGNVTSIDKRYGIISIPINSNADDIYQKKVKPFIKSLL